MANEVRFWEPDETVTRWVQPFESVPEFKVEMRRVSEQEQTRIFDKHKFFPGFGGKQTMARGNAVLRETFIASVVSWEGVSLVLRDLTEPVPCTDETKSRLAAVVVEEVVDGEPVQKRMSAVLTEKFADMEANDAKN